MWVVAEAHSRWRGIAVDFMRLGASGLYNEQAQRMRLCRKLA